MGLTWSDDLAAARGVTRWTYDVAPSVLEDAVVGLGRRCVVLDGSDVEDRTAFFRLCEQAFSLPEWFGHNWDALEECLADLDAEDGVVVLWSDWALFAEAEPDEYATALDVFSDTARTLGLDGTPFLVLLVGEGPDEDDEPTALDADDLELDEDDDADLALELDVAADLPADEAF